MAGNAPVIEAESLSKHFGHTRAVQHLSFTVPQGEIFGLLGPSGSGKTTTIRMILGVYAPDSGTLTVLGRPALRMGHSLPYRIGYMPQFFVLFRNLTVRENLNFVGMLYGLNVFKRWRRIRDLLEFLELWPHRRQRANRISGGQQRRLALAAALMHEPDLILLDEPTAGIDPILRHKLWDEFRRLKEAGATLVVTTQYVVEAEYCDQVAILSGGELVDVGTPEELRQRAFGGDVVEIQTTGHTSFTATLLNQIQDQVGVVGLEPLRYNLLRLTVADHASVVSAVVDLCEAAGLTIDTVQRVLPAFDDVFVRLVERHRNLGQEPSPPPGVAANAIKGTQSDRESEEQGGEL